MKKDKLAAASPLLLILLLSVIIIAIIMIMKGGTVDTIKDSREIKENVAADLQGISSSTDDYNQNIQEAINE